MPHDHARTRPRRRRQRPRRRHDHAAHDHSHHHANFRLLFWICLALTIPTLVFSTGLQDILGLPGPRFPGSEYVSAAFGIGGLPDRRAGVPRRRRRRTAGPHTRDDDAHLARAARRSRLLGRGAARLSRAWTSGGSSRLSSRSCCSGTGSRCARSRVLATRSASSRSCCPTRPRWCTARRASTS